MSSAEPVVHISDSKPFAVRVALFGVVGLALLGAVYLYAVRGTAIILDLASGMAGMFCF